MTYVEFAEKFDLIEGENLVNNQCWIDDWLWPYASQKRAKQLTIECDSAFKQHGELVKFDVCEKIFDTILDYSIRE